MSNSDNGDMNAIDGVGKMGDDVSQQAHIGFRDDEQTPDNAVHLETHEHSHRNDHGHVDLSQEEYTPDEVARLLGTSLEVVMSAVRQGELKAERQGQAVVCIERADIVDWMRRRGPGI